MKCVLSYVRVPILPMYTCLGASYCYKTFSCPHVLFIKGLISTSGSLDEWQKNASWQPQEREQKGARRYLFLPIQNIEVQFLAGHMSQRQRLPAAVDLRGSRPSPVTRASLALLIHVWEQAGMEEWPCCSLPWGLDLGGPASDGRKKRETHSVKTLSGCGWTFLDNCCPRVPRVPIPFLLILVVCWLTSSPTKGKRWLW